ncbi:MAG: hypothetical protein AAF690_02045 [Acidobacteriota bacterium]
MTNEAQSPGPELEAQNPSSAKEPRAAVLLLPVTASLLLSMLPLILGTQTLFLRDLTSFHLPVKHVQAESLRDGRVPLLDPTRGGGQPMVGNPNTVPLYPDNALYLLAPTLWAFNAHFWIHLLIAPFGMFWLARRWGLSVTGAAGAATFWGTSGFLLSQMNFYNLIAGTALVPAFLAAVLALLEDRPKAWRMPTVAVLWSLLILGGDPILAAQAGLLLVVLVALRLGGSLPLRRLGAVVVALGLGVLLALPQIVEFFRILPLSYRGYWGYDAETILVASLHPLSLWEWLLPFAFGRPSLGFWGAPLLGGSGAALFWSLFAGVLAVISLFASGVPRDRRRLGLWVLLLFGLFLALGGYNPVVRALAAVPGFSLARYPVKFVLLVAVAASLLAGRGFERLREAGALRGFVRAASALTLVYVATAALALQPESWLAAVIGRATNNPLRAQQVLQNWLAMSVFLIVLLWGGIGCLSLARRRPTLAALLFLMLHASSQLFLLESLLQMDDASFFAQPPALATELSERRVVHEESGAFGSRRAPRQLPNGELQWLARRLWGESRYASGALAGLRFELNRSPEGLDSFLDRMAADALRARPDADRIVLARALGAEVLLLDRPLPASEVLTLRKTVPSFGATLHAYDVRDALPAASLLTEEWPAPHLNAAIDILSNPEFDPLRAVVVPGEGPIARRGEGTVELLEDSPERVALDVDSPEGGVLLLQRSFQPLYRATIEGDEVEVFAANLSRLGVRVPGGRHRVVVEADRRPFRRSVSVALWTLVLLPWLGRRSAGVLEA